MSNWSQKPAWTPVAEINNGKKYEAQDGVTYADINSMIENLLYLKKYGGRVNALSIDATVENRVLKLSSKEA